MTIGQWYLTCAVRRPDAGQEADAGHREQECRHGGAEIHSRVVGTLVSNWLDVPSDYAQ